MTKEEIAIIYKVYRNSLEEVHKAGLAHAYGEHLLLRGIKMSELDSGSAISTAGTRTGDDVRLAPVFEVVDVGPDVPDGKVQVGWHVRFVSAAAQPTSPDGDCDYVRVHHEDLTEYWDPARVAAHFRGDMRFDKSAQTELMLGGK